MLDGQHTEQQVYCPLCLSVCLCAWCRVRRECTLAVTGQRVGGGLVDSSQRDRSVLYWSALTTTESSASARNSSQQVEFIRGIIDQVQPEPVLSAVSPENLGVTTRFARHFWIIISHSYRHDGDLLSIRIVIDLARKAEVERRYELMHKVPSFCFN
uniref:Uncharacterized protein n=1 Tax=Setaria digitata TaxID=48799 RepID=A0A915PMS2_9BILA